uniref:DNA 5'-3' helicase n=1 Tax=Chondria sp. (in: red algae) TaxID=1982705 RepID=A0A1Z1MD01_9FLOR|nr:Replication helicase subunit [Chondria sp. (in: red algae)]
MSPIYQRKYIPQNYLAEEILLGMIIIYPEIIKNISNIVKKEYFFLEFHELIYINILEIKSKKGCNIISLLYQLEHSQVISNFSGCKRIIRMMRQSQIFINLSNINSYIKELIDLLNHTYIKRLIIQYGYNIIKLGYGSLIDNSYIYKKILFYIKFIEREINNSHNLDKEITDLKKLLSFKLLRIKHPNIYNRENIINNTKIIKSGFQQLDLITNGLPNGNLIVIAGRPSVGKTSLAINIAYNTFIWQNISICFFSLEMSSKEVLNRIISVSCNLNIHCNLELSKHKWNSIIEICKKLLNNNIYINDKYNIDINYIEYITKNLQNSSNIKLVIIDYLQLIEFPFKSNKKLNRSQEIGYITRKLKLLAQLLKLPIIVLSQLNRNIEIRNDKEPLLSDLKESGCIYHQNNVGTNYLLNNINIMNFNHILKNLLITFSANKHKNIKNKNKVKAYNSIVYFSYKNLFRLSHKIYKLYTTYNHQYLSHMSWRELHKSTKSIKFNSIVKYKSYKAILLYSNYIMKVKYIDYLKTYDVNINNKFHFFSGNVVLHNSIEQDSDIIIILQSKKKDINDLDKTIIDIKVSKNRNGKTGSCAIKFTPETTRFSTLE